MRAVRRVLLAVACSGCVVTGAASTVRTPARSSVPLAAIAPPDRGEHVDAREPPAATIEPRPPSSASECFAGNWTGRGMQGHRSASFRLTVEQHGSRVRGVFQWVEFGQSSTEVVVGDNADCFARTATLRAVADAADAEPRTYAITLGADAERLTDGTESRFDGTWTAGAESGEVAGYRRNPN
jgi:hypothetical protein